MGLANHPQDVDSARLTVPIVTVIGIADVGSDSAVAESLASGDAGLSLDARCEYPPHEESGQVFCGEYWAWTSSCGDLVHDADRLQG